MVSQAGPAANTRLAEVICSLSLATDLATGQVMEHGLRRALVAVWLGQAMGYDDRTLRDVYYVALLGSVGCAMEAATMSVYLPDEIHIGEQLVDLSPTRKLEVASFFLKRAGAGSPPIERLQKLVKLVAKGPAEAAIVCRDVAMRMGEMLELGPAVEQAVGECHEMWSGQGWPRGLKGEEISLPARLYTIAHDVEIRAQRSGTDAAIRQVRRRSGTQYDPNLSERFCEVGPALLARLNSVDAWEEVLAGEPGAPEFVTPENLDRLLETIGNFVDSRSRFTLGHSQAVATLSESTARRLGLSEAEATAVRRAGLLHDLGRTGTPVTVWEKSAPLTDAEIERMRRHPSQTELLLARSQSLSHLGSLAGLHHERLDGGGYRGVPASFLPVAARILAAADAFQTKLEPRPHRPALSLEEAAQETRRRESGELDRDVVNALIAVAGPPAPRRRQTPAGLSEREVEVLKLAVRGLSNREIGEALFISPRTVGHHIAHIYDKIGVSSRVGAALYAQQHQLLGA